MRRKIIFSLCSITLVFLAGGIYIIVSIEDTTSTMNTLVQLHRAEILREHLLTQVKIVQFDISQGGAYGTGDAQLFTRHINEVKKTAEACFFCHHSERVMVKLAGLQNRIDRYTSAVSDLLPGKVSAAGLQETRDAALTMGREIIEEIRKTILLSDRMLDEKTASSLRKVKMVKGILYTLVLVGPLLAGVFAYVWLHGITKPVHHLLYATRRLMGGDLAYRIEGMENEFGEVAVSFNEMAESLKDHMLRIEESEKKYRILFESAGDAIFILDGEGDDKGRIVEANRAAAEMHGYTADELRTMTIMDLDIPEDAMKAPGRLHSVLAGQRIKVEVNHRKRDGTVFPLEVSAGLIELKDHKYILAFDRDITERRLTEETLQRAEQLRICGELATCLAHEIKNPLACIKIAIEIFHQLNSLPESERNILGKVIDEIGKIELLIKDLLNFAKPPKPQLIEIEVNKILSATIEFSLKHPSFSRADERKIIVAKDLYEPLPLVKADPLQLRQVFMNLLINAADAMPDGGGLTVSSACNVLCDSVEISFCDTGKGIETALLKKIFEPFFTTKAKGTGLGLAVVKRLIEQQGGSIEVRNNEKRGASFVISLPVNGEKGQV
ncbi:MAG: PAS domain S-box protein [Alphaproteobacteria bacterium]|uniref:histidine kinase n=1 Tax=Candidatus Nitrobium versatile TaxID=2884831 RepID=A0A953M106_9BACT|nr:PAS domain S-box protein [Candidatus Nitrobium versatile]